MKRLFSSSTLVLLALLVLVGAQNVTTVAYAQLDTTLGGLERALYMKLSPEYPNPNSTVNVSLSSNSFDLNTASIVWKVNGNNVLSGKGEKNLSVKVGDAGLSYNVTVDIVTSRGEPISRSVTITPTDVDLIWNADTFSPNFYKGKSLFTYEAPITIEAFPYFITTQNTLYQKDSLIYEWTLNNVPLTSQSGYGKSSVRINGSKFGKKQIVTVRVSTQNKTIVSYKGIEIEQTDPKILFYENSPLYGTLTNHALTNTIDLTAQEITIEAMPYFFSFKDRNADNLNYSWKLNGSDIPPTASKSSLTLRNEGDESGVSKIGLGLNDSSRVMGVTFGSFNIRFGE